MVALCIFIILEFFENFHLKISWKFHGIFKFSGCFCTLGENFHEILKILSENFNFKFSGTMLPYGETIPSHSDGPCYTSWYAYTPWMQNCLASSWKTVALGPCRTARSEPCDWREFRRSPTASRRNLPRCGPVLGSRVIGRGRNQNGSKMNKWRTGRAQDPFTHEENYQTRTKQTNK